MTLIMSAGPIAGVGVGVWALLNAREAVDDATELADGVLSADDREALDLADGVQSLFAHDAPARRRRARGGDPRRADAVVRIFVTGARGSGFVELAPDGEVLGVH